jgi:hypothetical protein
MTQQEYEAAMDAQIGFAIGMQASALPLPLPLLAAGLWSHLAAGDMPLPPWLLSPGLVSMAACAASLPWLLSPGSSTWLHVLPPSDCRRRWAWTCWCMGRPSAPTW